MTVATTDTAPDTADDSAEVAATTDPADADTDIDQDGPDVDAAAEDDADTGDGTGREAAKWRRKLRDAEAEHAARVAELETAHAATAVILDAQRAAVVDAAISAAKFDPEAFRPHLLVALGETGVDALLGEDGTVDMRKLGEAVRSTAAAFTPKAAGVQPNRQQGSPSSGGSSATWGSVLEDGARGGRRR